MKQINLIILLLLLLGGSVSAQNKTITGTVTDSATGAAIPRATIKVNNSKIAGAADEAGRFSLQVPASMNNIMLEISSVGYITQTVSPGLDGAVTVSLAAGNQQLNDVIVVGYGTTKKATLTGSIATIKGKDVTEAPVANVSNALAGRLPGLTSVSTSGEPGSDGSNLRIRGSNTFNDNSVLVVIDGVPGRSLERIDPYSIESITMLKDASAAIYGSQAANGVILVTTKRGMMGKPQITLNTNFGFNQPTRLPKMADAATYATMLNEIAYYNNNAVGLNSVYSDEQIQKFKDGSDPLHYPNTDWFKEVIKPTSAQNNQNITVSGGTDAMRYFVSLGAKHQDGNYYNSAAYYNQYDFRSNIDGKITKDIRIGVDIAGRLEDRNYPIRSAGDIFRGIIQSYPTSIAKWPGGEPGPAIEGGRNPVVTSTDAAGYNHNKYYALNSNLKLDINIPWVKGLSFSGNASFDQGFTFVKTFSVPFNLYTWDGSTVDASGNPVLLSKTYGGGTNNTPSLYQSASNNFNRLFYGLVNYETQIGNNSDLKVMVGSQVSKGNTESFNAYRDMFLSTAVQELFAGQTTYQQTGGSGDVNSRLSYFGRVNYSYASKYLLEFIWRYDGSYIFADNKRFGFFPGVTAGWVASNEKFWKDNLGFINYFKLRGSWGQTGNDRVAGFQYLTSYLFGYQSDNSFNYPFVTYSGTALTELKTLYESVLANPNITWEVANQSDIGFNASFLHSRLTVEADYFYYKRSNILWPQSANVPASAGLTLPSVNYGKASNQGFDFTIGYQDKTSGGFGYSVSVNGGYAKNKILQWGETAGVPVWQQTTGHPMGSGLYYLTDGIFHTKEDVPTNISYQIGSTPAAGDIRYIDYDHNDTINALDQVRIYKNNIPTFTFGANINLNYKGFDLSVLLQGATGAVVAVYSEAGQFGNYFESFAKDRWTPDNPDANGPRTFNRGNWYWTGGNDYWLHKADYLRLKTLQIGYTFSNMRSLQKAGISNLRLYFSGYNLLTYTPDLKDFDPEMAANTSAYGAAAGITGYSYPLTKVFSVGLTVGF